MTQDRVIKLENRTVEFTQSKHENTIDTHPMSELWGLREQWKIQHLYHLNSKRERKRGLKNVHKSNG